MTTRPKRPNLFVIGAPRCGTTTLHNYLARHPDVFMSTPKEPHFFCGDIHREFDAYQGGVSDPLFRREEQYLRLFERAGDERVLGESSVYYLYSPEAAERIAAWDEHARVVVMLRDPIDFLASLHAKLRWAGDEDVASFERALDLEEARRRGEHVPVTVRFPSILFYSRYADFLRWIEMYWQRLGRERVRVLLLDDFQRDPEAVYHEVLEHVGVDPIPLPTFEGGVPRNANMEPRFALVTRYLRRRGARKKSGRWTRLLMRLNSRVAPRRPLSPEARARLQERFRPGVVRLSAALDRDLEGLWGYGGSA